MNCSRCSAELPSSANVCYRCGSPTYNRISTTGAGAATSAPLSFSYLPTGTPPWPALLPQQFAASASAPTPLQSEMAAPAAKKPARSAGRVLQILAILVLTPIIGAALTLGLLYSQGQFPPRAAAQKNVQIPQPQSQATPQQTQSNQLPTPTSFKEASIKEVNLSLQYPSDWQTDPPQSSTTSVGIGIHPQQNLNIAFSISRFNEATSTQIPSPEALNQDRLEGFKAVQGVSNVQTLPSPNSQPTLASTTWNRQDATLTLDSGDELHLITISTQYKKIYYNIRVLTPKPYHDEAMQKYIERMFSSLKFLS